MTCGGNGGQEYEEGSATLQRAFTGFRLLIHPLTSLPHTQYSAMDPEA